MISTKYYRNLSISRRAAIWYVVCNILQKGIAFLVIPLYVRLLSTSEYGTYTIFQSWCNILIIFATLNLYCGVFTKAMVDYADDRDRYTSSMQGLATVITACFFTFYWMEEQLWNKYLEMDRTTVCLMFVYFLAFPSFSYWAVRQRVENKYKSMVIVTLLQSVATPLLSLFLLLNTDLRANAVIWGFLLSQALFGLVLYSYQFYKGRCFYDKDYWIHALKFNIPLIPHYLSLIVLGQIDRILIGHYCGKDKAGIYGLAYQISMIINVIVSGINGALVPWIYEKFRRKEYEIVKSQSNKLCVLVGVMTIIAMFITPEIVMIMGTKEYYTAIWIIPAISLSVYFQFCYGLFGCVEFYYNATKYVMIATTTGACISLIMNNLLLPIFGFLSAGYTSLTCYTVFMFMHYVFMRKVINNQLGGTCVFDIRFIGFSCFILLCIMFVCLLLYMIPFARYIVIMVMMLTLYLFRINIKSLFRLDL